MLYKDGKLLKKSLEGLQRTMKNLALIQRYVSAINLGATSKKTENKSNTYKKIYSNKKQKNNKGDTI